MNLTLRQIADKVGVTRRTAVRWAQLPDWPPVAEVRVINSNEVRFYDWNQVEDFLADTGRWDAVVGMCTAHRGPPRLEMCKKGLHDMTEKPNIYVDGKTGAHRCRACVLERQRKYRQEQVARKQAQS